MRTFTDAAGREWRIWITIGSVERLKNTLGVDLFRLAEGDPPLSARLADDPALVCHSIYVIARPAAGDKPTDEEFAEALGPRHIRDAMKAFWEELTDFFRELDRPDLAKLIEAQQELVRTVIETNQTRVRENLEAGIEKLMTTSTLGSSSGDWPESVD